MSDYFFKHFYDNVRDPSWPQVNTYSEFAKLPTFIKAECQQQHGLMQRLRQLEDRQYWISHSDLDRVYTYQNVAFLPVPKCASSAYIDLFHEQLGWRPDHLSNIDSNRVKVFSLIIHPLTRRLKGVVETLCRSFQYDFDSVLRALTDPGVLDFVAHTMIVDHHSTPYSLVFEPWFDSIDWKPMDLLSPDELQYEITKFLQDNHVNIDLPKPKKLNVSNASKNQIYEMVKTKTLSIEPPAELGIMFAKDLALYHSLVAKYATV